MLDWFPNTGDTIVDNFRAHLQDWENKTNSYRHLPPSEWKWGAMEGFYTELQNRREKVDMRDCGDWGYAPNPAGGIRWFYFAENTMAQKSYEVTMYLQIENTTRLTVRLVERRGPGIRAPLMYIEVMKLNHALLDRFTHHVHILEMNGDSFRLKQSKKQRSESLS